MFGWRATSTLWATATSGTKDTGPVLRTKAQPGWHLTMMDSSTLTATGMALVAKSTTTINGTRTKTKTGTTIATTSSGWQFDEDGVGQIPDHILITPRAGIGKLFRHAPSNRRPVKRRSLPDLPRRLAFGPQLV